MLTWALASWTDLGNPLSDPESMDLITCKYDLEKFE